MIVLWSNPLYSLCTSQLVIFSSVFLLKVASMHVCISLFPLVVSYVGLVPMFSTSSPDSIISSSRSSPLLFVDSPNSFE